MLHWLLQESKIFLQHAVTTLRFLLNTICLELIMLHLRIYKYKIYMRLQLCIETIRKKINFQHSKFVHAEKKLKKFSDTTSVMIIPILKFFFKHLHSLS